MKNIRSGAWMIVQICLLLCMACCVLGVRYQVISWKLAMIVAGVCVVLTTVLGFLGLMTALMGMHQGQWSGFMTGFASFLFSWIPLSLVLIVWTGSRDFPLIHDITTDSVSVPTYEVLAARRTGHENSPDYAGQEIATLQKQAYPDIVPLVMEGNRGEVFQQCLQVAESLQWQIVSSRKEDGIIEAVATTRIFRFHDDIIIRLTPEEMGVRVDIRSASRVGKGDLGANARRIREFFSQLRVQGVSDE
ncbi:DUF1499 domain-containing protein [Desulfogranum japonicum]|uniref:DUF1499 domain-containing protein n=1 Tax=Desulfogranum japonicum TaxID=231447 RepID=UPI0006878301|nr:DUF1499 domain-containing protein [Desulfogranum japonicum]